jgi:hypothetical protein
LAPDLDLVNYETEEFECPHGKKHSTAKLSLSPDDELFVRVFAQSPELAGKVNIHDPAGIPRNEKLRIFRAFGGIVAEKLVHKYLEDSLRSNSRERKSLSGLRLEAPPVDRSRGQIDLKVVGGDRPDKTIEVRSSFSFIARNMQQVIEKSLSLLGPYTTSVKPSEAIKDFHLTVIHRIPPEYIQKAIHNWEIDPNAEAVHEATFDYLLEQGIESHFVGGGTKQMFSDSELVQIDNLYQLGAKYRVIRPICNGLDAMAMSNAIWMQYEPST